MMTNDHVEERLRLMLNTTHIKETLEDSNSSVSHKRGRILACWRVDVKLNKFFTNLSKPNFDYVVSVVNGAGSGVLASKGSLSASRAVIKEYMGDLLDPSRLDSYAERLVEGQPTTYRLEYIVREENGMGIFHIFYITVLEREL